MRYSACFVMTRTGRDAGPFRSCTSLNEELSSAVLYRFRWRTSWSCFDGCNGRGVVIISNPKPDDVSDEAWSFLRNIADTLQAFPLFTSTMLKDIWSKTVQSEEYKLATLLTVALPRQSSDPRDRIHSLLGICKVQIDIDYTAPVSQVYYQTATALIRGGSTATAVLFREAGLTAPKSGHKLPSWAAHWDATLLNVPRTTSMISNADAQSPDAVSGPTISGHSLQMHGIMVEKITKVLSGENGIPVTGYILEHSLRPNVELARSYLDVLAQSVFDCPHGQFLSHLVTCPDTYPTGGTKFLALLRYWTGNQTVSDNNFSNDVASDAKREDVISLAKQFLMFLGLRPKDMKRFMEMARPFEHWTSDTFLLPPDGQAYTWEDVPLALPTKYEAAIVYFLLRRVQHLLTTSKFKTEGGLIGEARPLAEGDLVCILKGCKEAVVLRSPPQGERYQLVSCAFVVGMTDPGVYQLLEGQGKRCCCFTIS
ncbi:hypothetical protein M011DRAFT_293638 [Sporormia fimetaria CBS 119925]|uniref:Heterokaryon incompatibility domain-containing protein n=1 Tax=Sporormia fimetaria CBS 119925 TaxID=1340428 RepID=A0A6A6UYP9_9PLEO|nr:hypothetical protein M011DRAFT_293638 [Sporormia fimetaria CBS 119925]